MFHKLAFPLLVGILLLSAWCTDLDDPHEHNPIQTNEAFSKIAELRDDGILDFITAVKNDEEHFLFFYAEWCPACQDFKPTFNLLSESEFFENHGITLYRVNVIDNPELTARFLITSLPTLVHVREGSFRVITSKRWKLIEYFDEKQWTSIQPISSWKSPIGLFASFMGTSTRLGHRLAKDAEALQWPKWKWIAAFIISFAIAWAPALYLGLIRRDEQFDIHDQVGGEQVASEASEEEKEE
jgi:thiol-disulfide isomerase/thioredoxin